MEPGREKKEEKEISFTSKYENDGILYEQVNGGKFVYKNGDKFHYTSCGPQAHVRRVFVCYLRKRIVEFSAVVTASGS